MILPLTPIRFLLEAAENYGRKVGIVDGERRLTYAEMLDRSSRLAAATEDELREHIRSRLAGFKAPKSVEFRDELPKGATGKILKRALRDPYWEGMERHVQGSG